MKDVKIKKAEQEKIINRVRRWVESVVIGLNLCPFARGDLISKRLQFVVSSAQTEDQLLADLKTQLTNLKGKKITGTTLLIHPLALKDFYQYNQFLNLAEDLLVAMELEGIYQIASFHPDYQFADTQANDVVNYTNKSPYPLLHLIPEGIVEKALDNYPNAELIPERNMALLEEMGLKKIQEIYRKNVNKE